MSEKYVSACLKKRSQDEVSVVLTLTPDRSQDTRNNSYECVSDINPCFLTNTLKDYTSGLII